MKLSLTEARSRIGLRTPTWEAKKLIWSKVSVPTALISGGYKPAKGARAAHQADSRGVGMSGGWRAGKSLFAAMEALTWLPYAQLIWLVAKDYDMSRAEFIYLAEAALSLGLCRDQDVHLSLNKYTACTLQSINSCVVETRTLADFRKLASKAPDLVIICEPGIVDNLKQVMELVWGRVAEKRGCVVLAGTSDESSEEWYSLYQRWATDNPEGGKSFSMPSWENRHKFPDGINESEFITYREMYGQEAFDAHYGGVPAAPHNLVLRGFWSERLHVDPTLRFDSRFPIEIAIDPNYTAPNSYTVEAIQWNPANGDIMIVDEVSESGMHHDAIKELVAQKEWWPYVFGGTIDPFAEGNIHGGSAPATYWVPLPLRYDHRPRVATSIQAIKEALAIVPGTNRPRMTISDRCKRFRLEAARWKMDKYGRPDKRWCDALKATAYWLVDKFANERTPGWSDDEDESNLVVVSDWQLE